MPFPLTRILVTIISLLIIFCFSYISLASLTTPSSTRSAHNFLFPSTTVISLSDDNSTCFISRPAAFGPSIPKSGLKGELFVLEEGQLACDDTPEWDPSAATPPSVANQEDGTDDMNYASSASNKEKSKSQHADIESLQQSAEIEGKIVLVTRGGCGFLEKVLWAQRRGAVALIVGDYKRSGTGLGGSGLVTMYANGDTSNVTIPSVFTTHTTARLLTSLLPKYLTSLHHSMPTTEPPIPAPRAPAQPASKEEGKSRIKWLFPGKADSEPHESGMALSPTSTSSRATIETSTSIQKAATTPTMIAGSLPEWKGVQVDSSHRPPMSGELEGIVFVVKSEEMKKDDIVVEGENEREGLWITLTPMSMSTSPLFDTLLVLVISPLVTLTVVYALLLIRSMIRRRRWRAPKSVVDRLPVRTYQSTSTTTSPPVIAHPPPPPPSSSSSSSSEPPSLPETPSIQPSLHPQRSSSLPTATAASSNRGVEKNNSRDEVPRRSRYMGGSVECVVCLEEYVDGVSRVMRLPCGHEFHASCITPWLTTRRRTCPICKGDVVRGTAAGSSSGSGWTRHSDAGEISERTPLVAEDEGLEN